MIEESQRWNGDVFKLSRVEYKPPKKIIDLVTASNTMVIALENGQVIRINLENPEDLEEIEISSCGIRKLFLDPTGFHLLIALKSDETMYLHKSYSRARMLSKIKGIRGVGWDIENKERLNTSKILIGTSNGAIFEATIEDHSSWGFKGSLEKYFKQIYILSDPEIISGRSGIRSILWFRQKISSVKVAIIFVATATKLYQFVGVGPFEAIFSQYNIIPTPISAIKDKDKYVSKKNASNNLVKQKPNFGHPAPINYNDSNPGYLKSDQEYCELHLYIKGSIPDCYFAKSLAWFTPTRIMVSNFNFTLLNPESNSFILDHESSLLDFTQTIPFDERAVSMMLTEFHVGILYSRGLIQFISRLTNEIVHEFSFTSDSNILGLVHEPVLHQSFIYTETKLFEIILSKEDQNVWAMYLANHQYREAEKYCQEPDQLDIVRTAHADNQFENKQYEMAARLYAKNSKPFEQVVLQFIQKGAYDALRIYLCDVLAEFTRRKEKMQITVIGTWLVELYLNKLDELESLCAIAKYSTGSKNPSGFGFEAKKKNMQIKEEFSSFLVDYCEHLDKPTTLDLIITHGRTEQLLEYAKLTQQYDLVVAHYLQIRDYDSALNRISEWKKADLFYKYIPLIVLNAPKKCMEILRDLPPNLVDPKILVPALIRGFDIKNSIDRNNPDKLINSNKISDTVVDSQKISGDKNNSNNISNEFTNEYPIGTNEFLDNNNKIIKNNCTTLNNPKLIPPREFIDFLLDYLEYSINTLHNTDSGIHNLLLCLYNSNGLHKKLSEYLENANPIYFDLEYALYTCQFYNQVEACVWIYSKLGLYEDAVDLALSKSLVELAKIHANLPVNDKELRKKLWLRIAGHVVSQDCDITKVLQQCELLKIEDVLPFFQDFVFIDDFKDEITKSLQEYNKHIENLEQEMHEATETSKSIREDIDKLSQRVGTITDKHCCDVCHLPITIRSFYLFHCQHLFHKKCIIFLVLPLMDHYSVEKADILRQLLNEREIRKKKVGKAQPNGSVYSFNFATVTEGISSFFGNTKSQTIGNDASNGINSNINYNDSKITADNSISQKFSDESLKQEIDKILSSECPLCGEYMIESISLPFVQWEDNLNWQI